MNILIPHRWLLEHLETQATPQEIQKLLSFSGPSVERIYETEGDSVYDIEITTNRVDALCVRGIAREAAVILTQAGIPSKLKPTKNIKIPKPTTSLPFPQVINDLGLCKRTMGVILDNVTNTPTPEWMAERLRQTEQSVHHSTIDITNYITHELGHPCHAFDYDKVMKLGGIINIVEAKAGQKFTTLDGAEYTAVSGEVVFTNGKGEIIDLPAIMGTANTCIDDDTKRVLLWIESIPAQKVRFASMTHAIRTTAAQLNEKNVDPNLAETVLLRGIELYQELCQATVASPIFDMFPGKTEPQSSEVKLSTFERYLGLKLTSQNIISILQTLGCTVTQNGDTLLVTPPTFRPDLSIPADFVEEVARIYGYQNIPSTIMDTKIPLLKQDGVNFFVEEKIKRYLAALGWQEVYTYSLVSESVAQNSGWDVDSHLQLLNPLTDDRVYLRRTLAPSLAELAQNNSEEPDQAYFEFANSYAKNGADLPQETYQLCLLSGGEYREFRGYLESLLDQLYIKDIQVITDSENQPGYVQSASIKTAANVTLGTIGKHHSGYWVVELTVSNLVEAAQSHPVYQPLPKTAVLKEDLTFTISSQTPVGEVLTAIKTHHEHIQKVELSAVYKDNYTFKIWYHNPLESLSSAAIAPVRKALVQNLQKKYAATLVGSLEN